MDDRSHIVYGEDVADDGQLAFSFDPEPPRTATDGSLSLPRVDPELGRNRSLTERITAALRSPVRVIATDNRRRMISAIRGNGEITIRLHRLFLKAPADVVEELLCFLADGDRRAAVALRAYVEANREEIRKRPRKIHLRGQGEHHDLDAILRDVSAEHFPHADLEGVCITWARNPPTRKRRRRSIRLGTYTHDLKLVRIHPALDQASVPVYVVSFVVFHELLHHVIPPVTTGGRLDYHPPVFRQRERAHPDYARAVDWEERNLDALLRFTRPCRAVRP